MGIFNLKASLNDAALHSDAVRELSAEELQRLKNTLTEMILDVLAACQAYGIQMMLGMHYCGEIHPEGVFLLTN